MAIKILIASGKGGVGKSTAVSRLGIILAGKGRKVLLADCDAGLSSLDIMLGCRDKVNFSWFDAYYDRCSPAEAVIEISPNLFLLPAPANPVEDDLPDGIKKSVDALENDYDIIICDAPAGLGAGLHRAANASERAFVVATSDEVSVKGAEALKKRLTQWGIKETRLIINRFEYKAAKKNLMLTIDEVIDKSYVQLIGVVPEDPEIRISITTGKIKKKSKSYKAFDRIADRIIGKTIPIRLSDLK